MSTTPRTLSERDETYVGDIVRDENWLVNSSCTLSSLTTTITLHSANKEVLRITHDGHLVIGEGLSKEEATQEAAKLLIASFEGEIQKMLETRITAERETTKQLRSELNYAKASEELYHDEGTQLREKVRVLRSALERRHDEQSYYCQYVEDALAATKEGSE
jgi:hypothetical protein